MKKLLVLALLAIISMPLCMAQKSIYDFKVNNLDGQQVSMSDYKGKVILVVNVASRCGLTPQYEGLEALYEKYKDRGLVIVGFPCNQFLGQEPGTPEEIRGFCTANYGVSFPIMEKIDVNGDNAAPIYQWLKKKAPFKGYPEQHADFAAMLDNIHQKTGTGYDKGDNVRWNFGKFLIGRNGKKVTRFEPMVTPAELEAAIEKALGK